MRLVQDGYNLFLDFQPWMRVCAALLAIIQVALPIFHCNTQTRVIVYMETST